jgi:hypothetical protein
MTRVNTRPPLETVGAGTELLRRKVLLGGCALATLSSTAWFARLANAHHGSGAFMSEQPWYLEGRLTAVEWVNPHPSIQINVAAAAQGRPWDGWVAPQSWAQLGTENTLEQTTSPAAVQGVWKVEFGSLWRQAQLGFATPPVTGQNIAMVAVRACDQSKRELRALLVQYGGRIIQQQSHRLPVGCSGRQIG